MRIFSYLSILLLVTTAGFAAQDTENTPLPLPEPTSKMETTEIIEAPQLVAMRRLEAYMARTKSFKAQFIQQNADQSVARGTIYMQRPGRVRFDYSDGTPFLIVADGTTLNLIDSDVGQVTRWPVLDTPLRLLLADKLDLSGFHSSIEPAYGGHESLVALRAKDIKRPELGEITIIFRDSETIPGALELYRWGVVDGQGNATIVEVRDIEENPTLDKALWTFKDPRGIAKRRRNRR